MYFNYPNPEWLALPPCSVYRIGRLSRATRVHWEVGSRKGPSSFQTQACSSQTVPLLVQGWATQMDEWHSWVSPRLTRRSAISIWGLLWFVPGYKNPWSGNGKLGVEPCNAHPWWKSSVGNSSWLPQLPQSFLLDDSKRPVWYHLSAPCYVST